MVVTGIFKKKKKKGCLGFTYTLSPFYLYFFIIIYRYKGLAEATDIFTVQLKLPHVFATTDGAFLGPETV